MKQFFKRTNSVILAVFALFTLIVNATAEHDWTDQIAAYKPMVVNVETSSEVVFETEVKGTNFATGFVVDAAHGIIATNRHVTGSSPSYVKINFHDGSFTEARILYYDPTHDFGFYQIDPAEVDFALKAVELGEWDSLSLGDELLLIGNNEKEEYTIKNSAVSSSLKLTVSIYRTPRGVVVSRGSGCKNGTGILR